MSRDTVSGDMSSTYQRRKKQGLCVRCGAKDPPGSVCEPCRAKMRERHWKLKSQMRCTSCGRPSAGKTFCTRCSFRTKMIKKEHYNKQKNKTGNCYRCGQKGARKGKPFCAKCLEKKREYQNERYHRLRKMGLCNRCGKPSQKNLFNGRIASFCRKCARLRSQYGKR